MNKIALKRILLLSLALGALVFCAPTIAHAAITGKQATTTTSLVGWWTFDEGTSTTAGDSSGKRNAGTLTNAPTWVTGRHGRALQFNGTNQSVDVTNTNVGAYTGNFTVSTWVYKNTAFSGSVNGWTVLGKRNNNTAGWQLDISSTGRLIWRTFAGGSQFSVTGNTSLTTGVWYHVVAVHTSGSVSLYINGVLDRTAAITDPAVDATAFRIGYVGLGSGSSYWEGRQDDVRIYSQALSGDDVGKIYRVGQTAQKVVSGNGLIGWWKFDEGTSTVATDSSGNGNVANLSGFTWTAAAKRGGGVQWTGAGLGTVPTFARMDPLTNSFTVATWFKGSGVGDLVQTSNSNAGGFTAGFGLVIPGFACGNNKILFIFAAGGSRDSQICSNKIVTDNQWHHVVVSVDRTALVKTIYIDGAFDASSTISVSGNVGAARFTIGQAVWQNAYAGMMDDTRFYTRALSGEEMAALYKSNQTKANAPQNNRATDGLIGYWTFNGQDIGTAVNDVSGMGNMAAITNAPRAAIGKVGQAMLFNGTSNVLTVPDSNSLDIASGGEITISAWIKRTVDAAGYETIVSKRGAATNYELSLNTSSTGGSKALIFYSGGSIALSTTLVPVGEWVHIASVTNSTGTTYYVNGVSAGTTVITAGAPNTDNLSIGMIGGQYFRGAIDELRIYNRALSAAQIKQIYLLGK